MPSEMKRTASARGRDKMVADLSIDREILLLRGRFGIERSPRGTLPIRRRSSELHGGEAEHVAPVDLDHGAEAGGVRLPHAPKSRFG